MDIRSSILVFIVLLLESVSSDNCQPIVDSLRKQGSVYTHNEICYVFLNHEKTWVDARKQCETWGGDMVHIPDKETMEFIRRKLDYSLRWENNGVWIGLHSRGNGGWRWTTGDRQTYSYWYPGQPSKIFGLISFEDCACMRNDDDWKWHDYFCDHSFYKYKYICQFRMLTTTTTTTTTTVATTTTTEKTTTTSVATTTKKTATTTVSTLPATIAPVISIVYNKPLETTTPGTGHHIIIQGIRPDSSLGEQIAQNMRPKGDRGLSDSSKGAIIGLVLGGFIMVVVSCMIFILFRRRRRRKRESDNLTVQFESAGYMHGYSQGYSPVAQNEQMNHVANGNRPESHMYMDTSEMNRLYEQVTKQVDYGVNDYDQLKPKTGACCAGAAEGESCEDSDLKKEKVNLPEESDGSTHSITPSDGPSQLNNANEYVDMGAAKPKLTNLEVNTRRVEKQNNLQQSEPVYTNENFHRERLQTPTEEELEILDYEEHEPGDKLTDPLYDVVN